MSVVSLEHYFSDLLISLTSLVTIAMWGSTTHFVGRLCPVISVSLTLYLSLAAGASWRIACMTVLLELYQPTFGKRAHKGDLPMPADDYCFYHCINYVLSNGEAKLTTTAAMRFRAKVVARLRDTGLSEQAT